jgi:hypothetical protein
MKEREKKSGSVGCFIMGVIGFMGLLLYVFSIGPVFWLAQQFPSLQWIGVFYFPIGLLSSVCPPVDWALQWYLDLFR